MRSLVRTFSAIALAALVTLVPATAASAKKPKPAAWAKKHKLKGTWRAKDADRDGVKNLQEFKLGTNPRKADSDRDGLKDGDEVKSANNPLDRDSDDDGIKDGAEHAGVVTAFDGETITIRQFKGPTITATLDASSDCGSSDDDDPTADDSSAEDDGFVDATGDDEEWDPAEDDDLTAEAASFDGDEEELDLGDDSDDSFGCDASTIKKGDVLTSAQLETRDGVLFVAALEVV